VCGCAGIIHAPCASDSGKLDAGFCVRRVSWLQLGTFVEFPAHFLMARASASTPTLQEAWFRVSDVVSPHIQAAASAVQPAANALVRFSLPFVAHIRGQDSPTLATYSAAAGLALLYVQHRRSTAIIHSSKVPSRRRLYLSSSAVTHASVTGAESLTDLGVTASSQVLIAAQSMEAVEIFAYCALLRAESVLIEGSDLSSSVAFALRVRPVLLVYDTLAG